MTLDEIRANRPEGATHYLRFYDELWYLRWSFLLGQYVTFHEKKWVTFIKPKNSDVNPL